MAVTDVNNTQDRATYFQNVVERMLTYWRDHDAIKTIDVTVLDRERNRILKNITLGLDLQPLWPLVKKLVIAFAPYMERRGLWDSWHGILEQAIRMAQRADDVDAETTLTSFLARLCQRMSRPEDVVRHYKRGIKLARQCGNLFEEARACSNLGYLYIDGGHWWRSEVLSQHALAIFEELGSDHGRAHTHNHLGLLYTSQGLWDSAENNLKIACRIWKTNNDNHSLIYGFINLGLLYVEIEEADSALEYLTMAYEMTDVTGELSTVARILNNMAIAYRLKLDWSMAEKWAQEAERIFKEHSDMFGLANVLNNLGLIAYGIGKRSLALNYLKESLSIHRAIENQSGISTVQDDISRVIASPRDG